MERINDFDVYTKGMCTSIHDKLWFLDCTIDWDNIDYIVDFGCADGSLMKALYEYYPNKYYIGYDIDKTMLSRAEKNFDEPHYTSDPDTLRRIDQRHALFISSSVLHEVNSYCNKEETNLVIEIFNLPWRYVAIRDMYAMNFSGSVNMGKIREAVENSDEYKDRWYSFRSHYGDVSERQFIKFLMTRTYTANWNRELREDYFVPMKLLNNICGTKKEIYSKFYMLPYFKMKLEKEFGISLDNEMTTTHFNLLLEGEEE